MIDTVEKDDALKQKIRRQTVEYIRDLSNRIHSMEEAKKELIEQLQADCPHPTLVRVPFREGTICDQKPMLLCTVCRDWGDEWNFETRRLTAHNPTITEVTIDAFWKARDLW